MHIESMGLADPDRDGHPVSRPPLPMVIGELSNVPDGEEGSSTGRARDTAGRFIAPSAIDTRLRESGSDGFVGQRMNPKEANQA